MMALPRPALCVARDKRRTSSELVWRPYGCARAGHDGRNRQETPRGHVISSEVRSRQPRQLPFRTIFLSGESPENRANPQMLEMTAPKRGRGRPNRAETSALALAGIDLSACDPVVILQSIALDISAPAAARVAACRELRKAAAAGPVDGLDEITRAAIRAMNGLPN
jgi:hypothetical protein